MNKKKFIYIVSFAVIVALGVGIYFLVKSRGATQEIILQSEGANWTTGQNIALQQGLVNAVGKYLEAVSYTNAVFLTDIENTEYEEWRQKLDKAIQSWEELEAMEQEMEAVFEELNIPEESQEQVFKRERKEKNNFFVSSAYAASEIPELGAVTAVFDSAGHGSKIRTIMEVFGWDRETAFYHLKREQDLLEAEAWDKAGDTYQRWETAARIVKDTSKITVYIGANIITAGGASAAVGAVQATTMVVGGVSLVIEVGEDINIAIGNEENAAALRSFQKKIKPLVEVVCIASLSDMGDPGNLFYIADKAGELYKVAKEGYLYVVRDKSGKIIISEKNVKNIKIPEPPENPEEAKKAGLPEGNYKIDGKEVKVEEPEEEKEEGKEETKEQEEVVIKDLSEILNLATTLATLKAAQKPTIEAGATRIKAGEVNTLNVTIPEGFKGPFKIEQIDVGGSGAGIVLPSSSDSRTFSGEFVSSKGGVFVVKIKITDAEGNIYTTQTTIFVEGAVQEGISIDTGENVGMDFTCITLSEFPSSVEGCHINIICPNSRTPCAEIDEEFLEKVRDITEGYRDLGPYQCSEVVSIDACKAKDQELCQQAWEGEDLGTKKSIEDMPEVYRDACSPRDLVMCEAEKDALGSIYERCMHFLSADGPYIKTTELVTELMECYTEVRERKSKACGDSLSESWNKSKEEAVQRIRDARAEQQAVLDQERPRWDKISVLKEQIYKLDPEEDADKITELNSQIAALEAELDAIDQEYDRIDNEITRLEGERDAITSLFNDCVGYCYKSISDTQSKAVGMFIDKTNELYDYKSLMEIIK